MSNDNATLTACREALAAMEQAEAAMPAEQLYVMDCGLDEPRWFVLKQLSETSGSGFAGTNSQADAELICTAVTAFPGTLRGWRTLRDMCEAWLLDPPPNKPTAQGEDRYPSDGQWEAWSNETYHWQERKEDALAMLAALADAMGVTGGGHASQK